MTSGLFFQLKNSFIGKQEAALDVNFKQTGKHFHIRDFVVISFFHPCNHRSVLLSELF